MAMLLNPKTFLRTWERQLTDDEKKYIENNRFWERVIPGIKDLARATGRQDFEFFAEAYWDKEELERYFDGIYNDDLYKHLRRVAAGETAHYLRAHVEYLVSAGERKCHDVVYVENHDEERAATAMGERFSEAAAVLTGMIPGSIFLVNQGQEQGRRIRPPMQIGRYPQESRNGDLARFYGELLAIRKSELFQKGEWKMIEPKDGDPDVITIAVSHDGIRAVICVNMNQKVCECGVETGEEEIEIYNMTTGEYCPPQERTNEKIRIGLEPGEVKIMFLKKL
jgi:hypothetical protein